MLKKKKKRPYPNTILQLSELIEYYCLSYFLLTSVTHDVNTAVHADVLVIFCSDEYATMAVKRVQR